VIDIGGICDSEGSPIAGVTARRLVSHVDLRGDLTEIHRTSWELGKNAPVQWNFVRSGANVMRGVHLHKRHEDTLAVLQGEMLLGLSDLRPSSPTHGVAIIVRMQADTPAAINIPVGVAHGFYFAAPSIHIYGVDVAFDGSDEFGCRWNDPGLGLDWPCDDPVLSERDIEAGSLQEMLEAAGPIA
jgi:dTDP-4-dehydrorhamnose 3,5-epimerase